VAAVDVRVDPRPRQRRMAPVVATGVAALAAAVYVRAVDPNIPGHYPGCPSRMFFGVDCPGCGGMRGTYELLHGNLGGMLESNILLLVAWPVVVFMFFLWVYRAWTGRLPSIDARTQARRHRLAVGVLVFVLAFGVIRNFVPYLGTGV
jgi:hypothetical protein